jgi:phospholipase C
MRRVIAVVVPLSFALVARSPTTQAASTDPIEHVVIVVQENHSFDNVLGRFCVGVRVGTIQRSDGCRGRTSGRLPNGTRIALSRATDVIPFVNHSVRGQQRAIDVGAMDGFGTIRGCTRFVGYQCYSQFAPSRLPNVVKLATRFGLSDATFELRGTPSWAGHMVLGSATLDGFYGNNPHGRSGSTFGWGCDAVRKARWSGIWKGTPYQDTEVPSCVPDHLGDLGAAWSTYTGPRAAYVPTIFDRLDDAGRSWRIFAGDGPGAEDGYSWSICPTFYECLSHPTTAGYPNFVASAAVLTEAQNGTLPSLSIVTPKEAVSQHNSFSMTKGDDWIGRVLSAVMRGPDWPSTAVFITWDDCGCFYDHMNPLRYNSEWGIRVPMIIVGPYARPGFTDRTPATYASLLAFVEQTFGLTSLHPCATQPTDPECTDDVIGPMGQAMYDFSDSFDWSQEPLPPIRLKHETIPKVERRYIRSLSRVDRSGT